LQRRVEIARALATSPKYLLLDEPAAGMNERESDDLRDLIAELRRKSSYGIIVVDHDLRLIMQLCDTIHVLNEGQSLCEGDAATVRGDPAVIEAYLGAERRPLEAAEGDGTRRGIGPAKEPAKPSERGAESG